MIRRRNARSGFTLIELILVVVILATLAAVVVPKLTGRSEEAKVTAAKTQISSISTALDAFEVDNGYYPKGKDGLVELMQQPKDATHWRGPYLKQDIPNDPWGQAYIYECPGKNNETGYDLMSMGPDQKSGGNDDITNWSSESSK